MDKHAFVNNLYNKITEAFVKNVNDQEKEMMSKAYIEYLHNSYDTLFDSSGENDYDAIATVCVKKEKTIHLDIDVLAKKAFLFPDSEFLKLQDVSFEIAEVARLKKLGEDYILSKTKDEYIKLLNDCLYSVDELFKYSAERLFSEAIMDISYIFGDTDIQSFRTSIL